MLCYVITNSRPTHRNEAIDETEFSLEEFKSYRDAPSVNLSTRV